MKIAIDLSQIERDGAGVNNYTKGILDGFAKFTEHEFVLCFRSTEFLGLDLPNNFSTLVLPPVSKFLGGGVSWYALLGVRLRRIQVDYLISATLSIAPMFAPTVVILHDLAPLTHPETFEKSLLRRFRFNIWVAKKFAKRILAVTESTRDKFKELFPEYEYPIGVTSEGLSKWTLAPQDTEKELYVKKKLDLPGKFIFSLGTIQPRKNYLRAVRAFAEASKQKPNLHYVIGGGKGWMFDQVYKEVEKLGVADRVHFLGFIDVEDLPYVFDNALGLVQISLEEGFGLPIIEARARSLPLMLSDIPVFRELRLDIQPIWVDPVDLKSIYDGMVQLAKLRRIPMPSELREVYSWEQTARNIINSVAN